MAFLGIRVPTTVGKQLSKIDVPGEKSSTSELHITLLYFGKQWPVSEISKALEACYEVTSKFNPFFAKLTKVTSFSKLPNDKFPVISKVESEELHHLRTMLANKFDEEKIEFSKTYKDFNPHVTLSYSDTAPEEIEFSPVEFAIEEVILWGGDHGEDRIFVTLPLGGTQFDKDAMRLKKSEILDKIAKNLMQEFFTPSTERRKTER
jgi:2'-5' RNA ligase